MTDPYAVLGLAPDASQEQVRAAYLRLAFEHHPDRNPGDPAALDRFHLVRESYDALAPRRAEAGRWPARPPDLAPLVAAAFARLMDEVARAGSARAALGRTVEVEAGGLRVTIRIGTG